MNVINKNEVSRLVIKVIAEALVISRCRVTPTTKFLEDLDVDEVSVILIVLGLQDKFGLEISDEEAKRFLVVQDVIDLVSAHAESAKAADAP